MHKSDTHTHTHTHTEAHTLVSKDDFILIVSGILLPILGAIYDMVSVSHLTGSGFLEESSCPFGSADGFKKFLWNTLLWKPGDNRFKNL